MEEKGGSAQHRSPSNESVRPLTPAEFMGTGSGNLLRTTLTMLAWLDAPPSIVVIALASFIFLSFTKAMMFVDSTQHNLLFLDRVTFMMAVFLKCPRLCIWRLIFTIWIKLIDKGIKNYQFPNSSGYKWWKPSSKLYLKFSGAMKFTPILLWDYMGSFVPFQQAIYVVVGKPIEVEKYSRPTMEEVAALHSRFVEALLELFEKHKKRVGYVDLQLKIL